jgi:hypothetical protein
MEKWEVLNSGVRSVFVFCIVVDLAKALILLLNILVIAWLKQ